MCIYIYTYTYVCVYIYTYMCVCLYVYVVSKDWLCFCLRFMAISPSVFLCCILFACMCDFFSIIFILLWMIFSCSCEFYVCVFVIDKVIWIKDSASQLKCHSFVIMSFWFKPIIRSSEKNAFNMFLMWNCTTLLNFFSPCWIYMVHAWILLTILWKHDHTDWFIMRKDELGTVELVIL